MDKLRRFAFGSFVLIPQRQLLLDGDTAVRIGGRALDLLTALVERAGEVVTKRELISLVWPTTTVDDGNLKVHMAALRRALRDDADAARYIATVTGRGYRFIAPLQTTLTSTDPAPHAVPPGARVRLIELPAAGELGHGDAPGVAGGIGSAAMCYAVVLDGEITLRLDDTALLLAPGSLVVQPGPGHGWSNHSGRPCRLLFVLGEAA